MHMVVKGGKLAKWEFKVRRVTPQEKKSIKNKSNSCSFHKDTNLKIGVQNKISILGQLSFLPHSLVIMEGPCFKISLDCNNLP